MAKPRRPILRDAPAPKTVSSLPLVAHPPDARQSQLFDLPLPDWIEPCLATLVSKAPSGPDWIHEIKWDGYRISAYVNGDVVTIRTRIGHDWTVRFPAIADALAQVDTHSAVIDGEAVVLDEQGKSDFGALQVALGKSADLRGKASGASSMPLTSYSSMATT